MNATRAASIRLRAAFDGAVSLGRVQTPTLALVARREVEIRAFVPEPYWLVEALFEADGERRLHRRATSAASACPRRRRDEDRRGGDARQARRDHASLRSKEERETPGAPLRPDLAPAPREHALRLLGAPDARRLRRSSTRSTRRSPIRGRARATCRATWSRRSARPPSSSATTRSTRRRRSTSSALQELPLAPHRQRREGHRPPRDHPDPRRARPREVQRGRAADLRPRRQALPFRLLPGGGLRAHARRDDRRRARLPHERPRAGRGRLARGLRRGGAPGERRRRRHRRRPAAAAPRAGRGRRDDLIDVAPPRRRSRRGASRRPRSSPRWRPPARTSRTPTCARR